MACITFLAMAVLFPLITPHPSSYAAVNQADSRQAEEMKKLHFLVGEWKGNGTVVNWDNTPGKKFSQHTRVEARVENGVPILRVRDSRNHGYLHGAYFGHSEGDISYNEQTKIYNWRPGRKITFEGSLVAERVFQFGVPFTENLRILNGTMRFTITITTEGEWHEKIEVWKIDRWTLAEQSVLKRTN